VTEDRLRQHPKDRLASPVQLVDLGQAAARLRSESHSPVAGHRQLTLVRHGPVTLILFVFEANGFIKEHRAEGEVIVHVLDGGLRVTADYDVHQLGPGALLAIAPGLAHSVLAEKPTEMLLTIHKSRRD
jgi:quercetin dioxygenase-like cupin family protein